jgi:sulfide:quinone oxidoreductase
MADKTVLIIGGGIGGLVSSSVLKKKVGERARVVLIERKQSFQFPPSYLWVMLGKREPEQVQRKLAALEKKGIEVVHGEVSKVDPGSRTVQVDGSSFSYDYLVIALGAEYAPERIPGLRENSHHIYDLESALRFRSALEKFDAGTLAVGISSLPFKCPAAPYEAALLLDYQFRERGLGDKVKIRFFTPEGLPLPSAGPEIGNKTAEFIKSRGVEMAFKLKLKEVKPGEAIFEDGSKIAYDLLCAVPPHKPPQLVVDAGLTDQSGWIPVDPATMETKHANVYAVGDVASVATPSGFVPFLPKAGVFAHGQAEVVANNIAAQIGARGGKKLYDGSGACFLMVGGAQSAFVKGNWYTKPQPSIQFHSPSRILYMQRVLFEKYWLRHWF